MSGRRVRRLACSVRDLDPLFAIGRVQYIIASLSELCRLPLGCSTKRRVEREAL